MAKKEHYWCDKLETKVLGNREEIDCKYHLSALCYGACFMGRIRDICKVAEAIRRGDLPEPSQEEWLKRTLETGRMAESQLAQLNTELKRVLQI